MKRAIYWFLVLLPGIVIGLASALVGGEDGKAILFKGLQYTILLYLPIISVIRMKYLKFSIKQILSSFIPFYGLKFRQKIYFDK
jgi:hypothetical protein